jgi:hypothetical protein
MDEDVDISPNATSEEIGMELVFQETLLQTLDPDSYSYEDDKKKIERKIEILQGRYDAVIPPDDDLRGSAHEMLDDVLDSHTFYNEDEDGECNSQQSKGLILVSAQARS